MPVSVAGSRGAAPGAAAEGSPRTARRRRLSLALRVGLGVTLLGVLLAQTSLGEVFGALAQVTERWPLLLVATCMPGVGCIFAVLRWQGLLAGIGGRVPFARLYRSILIASFFNHFAPSTIGGDVVRGWWLGDAVGASRSFTVVGVDRLIGMVGICTVGLLAAVATPSLLEELPQVWIVIGIVAAAVVALALAAHPRVAALRRRIFEARVLQPFERIADAVFGVIGTLRESPGAAVMALVYSVAAQLVIIVQYVILSAALGVDLGFATLCGLIPIVTLVALLPVSINGIGLRESALAVLGAGFGLSTANAVALAWLFLAFQFVWATLGGLLYLFGGRPGGAPGAGSR